MIFDTRYDTSLYYIAKANNKNREELLEFIKEIPEDLIEKIRYEIARFHSHETYPIEDSSFYSSVSEKDPRIIFSFNIDNIDQCLTIKKAIEEGPSYEELFELMLYPFDLEGKRQMMYSTEECLGIVTNNVRTFNATDRIKHVDVDQTEYDFHHLPIGYYVTHTAELFSGKGQVTLYRPVSLKKVPKDINRNNILQRKMARRS